MRDLALVALVGFLASLVDGALGMGFGPTSSTLLLASGFSPVNASATVNLAKVATGFASAVSHWRFGNIDRRLVLRLAIPGMAGAFLGVIILMIVDGDSLRPILAVMLLAMGIRITLRFSRSIGEAQVDGPGLPAPSSIADRQVGIAGGVGGITNGLVGAWGPVVTPWLLHRGLAPRVAVGSANTAEVAVAVVSAGALIGSLGGRGLELGVSVAMIAGGVLAAPLGAYVIKVIPARLLGLAVGGLLMLTQVREFGRLVDSPVSGSMSSGIVLLFVVVAGIRPRLAAHLRAEPLRHESDRANQSARQPRVGVVDE
ncbi:MAG: sulfite exporter TauE/SafE family protein [Acidimicrobiia bacterium]|nr:sulfite exporter TauE/SafE family protein [Acidimicrobiia bacterium]